MMMKELKMYHAYNVEFVAEIYTQIKVKSIVKIVLKNIRRLNYRKI
jgi:hypothetical protein